MKNLTKKDAEKYFKTQLFDPSDTWTDKRLKWNDFIETLRRDGEITEHQATTWDQPDIVKPPAERKKHKKTTYIKPEHLKDNYFYESNCYSASMRETYIQKDVDIFNERLSNRWKRKGILTGDFVIFNDGTVKRVAYVWSNEEFQTCAGGSFYLNSGGSCTMSGSLDSTIKTEWFTATKETMNGSCWIFSQGFSGGSRGIDTKNAPFRVWRQKPESNFSPKWEWEQISVAILPEEKRPDHMGYKYLVHSRQYHTAFRTDDEFEAFKLKEGLAVGREAVWPGQLFLVPVNVKNPNE